ncbi:hypothetical protein N657DRAFT_643184 [Parathielavia appendiculata]|uniref:Uncharacterized protein n=1 Tax=Parathielavia appendiculata TaxID=2587402 RepID=A0AAN6Z6U7_9PEZI|nr:hypothetical protein N657DRAFT_643184 [Parathielavia appendiculata]
MSSASCAARIGRAGGLLAIVAVVGLPSTLKVVKKGAFTDTENMELQELSPKLLASDRS